MILVVNSNMELDNNDVIMELVFTEKEMFDFAKNFKLTVGSYKTDYEHRDDQNLQVTYRIKNYIEQIDALHNHLKLTDGKKAFILRDEFSYNNKQGRLIKKLYVEPNYVGIRSAITGNGILLSVVPYYEGGEPEKIEYFDNNVHKDFEKKYILFFEKRSETYGESSYQVFQKYKSQNENCRFILSEQNPDFEQLKQIHGDKLIKKGSYEFYDILFRAKLLVSSELPANLISGRSIDMDVNSYLNEIPFIFLQHGIMFGKPVNGPKAKMFWRKNIKYNLVKMVVSSEAEKEQLYAVGYKPEELINTGLATLDQVNTDAIKKYCAYMPTYRAWEDIKIYNNEIEDTTYYQDTMNVIKMFKELNKLDDLIIVPHPGYDGHIDYETVFQGVNFASYTDIRDELKLYITDFSSASFDAQFRGAALMYYWNRRDELEGHYGAKAPLHGGNTNGIPITTDEDFKNELERLYANDFKMDNFYIENFKEKMEHNDFKNTDRIIEHIEAYLKEDNKPSIYERFNVEGEEIYCDPGLSDCEVEAKKKNLISFLPKLDELKIQKLLATTFDNENLVIKLAANEGNDHYVIFEDTMGKEKPQVLKVKPVKNKVYINLDFIKQLNGYSRIIVMSVPTYAKPLKYVAKCEIDNRTNSKINIKVFKSLKRDAPYIQLNFVNLEEEEGFYRLYKHDNTFEQFVIQPSQVKQVQLSSNEYSHYVPSKNVMMIKEKIQLSKKV